MNEQDEEYEMMKLGAEVIKERLDKVEPLEERIDRIEKRLHSNDLKMRSVVECIRVMSCMIGALRIVVPETDSSVEVIIEALEDAGDDIVHEDWW